MVCEKCKAKLSPLNTAAVWKEGATNTIEAGGTRAKNTLLYHKRAKRDEPVGRRCGICQSPLAFPAATYCHDCAFKKGICSICGRQVLDTTFYKMSNK